MRATQATAEPDASDSGHTPEEKCRSQPEDTLDPQTPCPPNQLFHRSLTFLRDGGSAEIAKCPADATALTSLHCLWTVARTPAHDQDAYT